MKKLVNGNIVDMTDEEIAAKGAEWRAAETAYWQSVDYGEAVNAKIRELYSESQEFAILRQKEEKPEEYEEYFTYCEACKEFVKIKKKPVRYEPTSMTSEAKCQRRTVSFCRNVLSVVPRSKVKLVAKMLKAIHAQESKKAAQKVEDSVEETLTYCDFPCEH